MMLFTRRLKLTVALVCGLALCTHGAQAPQHININQLSTTVEDVVVPLPNEIFGALNKLGVVNWNEHVRSDEEANFTERPRIALLLGTVIADGFIAADMFLPVYRTQLVQCSENFVRQRHDNVFHSRG